MKILNSEKRKLDFSNFSSQQIQSTTQGKYVADHDKWAYKPDNRWGC